MDGIEAVSPPLAHGDVFLGVCWRRFGVASRRALAAEARVIEEGRVSPPKKIFPDEY